MLATIVAAFRTASIPVATVPENATPGANLTGLLVSVSSVTHVGIHGTQTLASPHGVPGAATERVQPMAPTKVPVPVAGKVCGVQAGPTSFCEPNVSVAL